MLWRSLGPIAIALGLAGCALDSGGAEGDGPETGGPSLDATTEDVHTAVDGSSAIDVADAGEPLDAYVGDDGASSIDGPPTQSNDAEIPDAAPDADSCAGVMCNGVCLAAADCATCTAAPLLCANTRSCTADCASCAGTSTGPARPIECYKCDANRLNPVGTCEPRDPALYCLNGSAYGTALHCGCSATVPCPGRTEVCTDIGVGQTVCATCGEALSDLHACVGGGTCSQIKQTCD